MKTKFLRAVLIITLAAGTAKAQQSLIYNHYYLNPFLYNPSYVAPSGYSELYLNYRKQWNGISGAPTTYTASLHLPLSYKAGVAFTAYQDEAGLLKTTSGLVSFAYQIYFGTKVTDVHKLSFGLSAGVTNSRIDSDAADDKSDPVLGNNTSSLDGQVGVHYRYNGLKIGFSIPRLFDTKVASEESFNKSGIAQLNTTISAISYDFRIGTKLSIEPMVTYRTYENLDSHYEVLTNFKLSNIGWIGGGYREGYGAFSFLGVNVKDRLKVGYAYEFATEQSDKLGNGSHEVQLVLRLGKKQFTRPVPTQKQVVANTTPVAENVKEEVQQEKAPEPVQEEPKQIDPVRTEAAEPKDQEPVQQQPAVEREKTIEKENIQPVETAPVPEQKPTKENIPAAEHAGENAQTPVTRLSGEDLAPGHYVVVGAFQSMQNAKTYAATLKKAGYPANVVFHPGKGYYLVHMDKASSDLDEARQLRDKYRQMSRYSFRDTWILSIE
jgi:type IX secretion system PorP/SprF family membrane protein